MLDDLNLTGLDFAESVPRWYWSRDRKDAWRAAKAREVVLSLLIEQGDIDTSHCGLEIEAFRRTGSEVFLLKAAWATASVEAANLKAIAVADASKESHH